MNLHKTFLNVFVISSLILLFCYTGSKQVFTVNETAEKEINYIPYYLKVYEADSLYIIGNYRRSFEILDSLFKDYAPINTNYNEVGIYLKSADISNKKIDYEFFFEILFADFGFNYTALQYDTILLAMVQKYYYDSTKIKVLESKYQQKIDNRLRSQIQEMVVADQLYRTNFNQENQQKMDTVDLINEQKLKQIFETVGYPNYEICCNNTNQSADISIVLMHTGDSIRENYFAPKVLNFVRKGKCDPIIYGQMTDQIYVYRNGVQLYGTYLGDPLIYDTMTTNKMRHEIGLPSLEFSQWKFYIAVKEDPHFFRNIYKNRPDIFKDLLKENPTIFNN